jgi:hypothetical protein
MQFWSSLFGRLLGRVPCVRKRVLVNVVTGDAFQGVLWQHAGAWLVLKDVTYVPAGKGLEPRELDGDVVVECAKVVFIQVCGGC